MELPDVNVLIYAHREDAPEHDKYAAWLVSLADGAAPFALSSVTLGGFVRIVTNHRIFQPATPILRWVAGASWATVCFERISTPVCQPPIRANDRSDPPYDA